MDNDIGEIIHALNESNVELAKAIGEAKPNSSGLNGKTAWIVLALVIISGLAAYTTLERSDRQKEATLISLQISTIYKNTGTTVQRIEDSIKKNIERLENDFQEHERTESHNGATKYIAELKALASTTSKDLDMFRDRLKRMSVDLSTRYSDADDRQDAEIRELQRYVLKGTD